MTETTAGKLDNKRVKFSDKKINELFTMLRQKTHNYDLSPLTDNSRWWYSGGYVDGKWKPAGYVLTRADRLNELKERGTITSTDVNAYLSFPAGNSYDHETDESRTQKCQRKAQKVITEINTALATSSDPLFSQLHAELKNTKIDFCYEKKDSSDDGYDLYCCELWLKISYAK